MILSCLGKFTNNFEKAIVLYTKIFTPIMKLFVIDIKEEFDDLKITTPIVISNHINWFDTFYFVLRFLPISFISKIDVAHYPIVGALARGINCVFLDRNSMENRKLVV